MSMACYTRCRESSGNSRNVQHRQAVPILAVRGVYIQRNQVGLMLDLAACIVGPKEEREAMQIDSV